MSARRGPTPATAVGRIRRECLTCIALLERTKPDARALGQLEALRHVLTVISAMTPARRARRPRA